VKKDTEENVVKGLEELEPHVTRHMRRTGIKEATGPQELALGPILSGEDVLLIAPTGFGKTEATFGPLLQKVHGLGEEGISLLYIAPLRALNRDMLLRMGDWCSDLGLTIAVRHSDTTPQERAKQARRPPDVLVTTPETLQIMFTGSRLRRGLLRVRYVIVDEIHELFGDERGAQLDFALSRLDHLTGRKIQRVGLSATVQDPEEVGRFLGGPKRRVMVLTGGWRKDLEFLVHTPRPLQEDHDNARELGCTPRMASVIREIRDIIRSSGSTLVFVNSRDLAEALTTRLRKLDPKLPLGIHHGSLSRDARIEMESSFKDGRIAAIVSTSSLELGMDIGRVDRVIQFKSPKEVSRLLQRAGRAAHRVEDTSRCTILATEPDDALESAVISRMALAGRLERRTARRNIRTVLANQILSMTTSEGEIGTEEFYELALSTYTFGDLPRSDNDALFRFLADMRLIYLDPEGKRARRGRNTRRYFYDNISMIPDERVLPIKDISSRTVIGSLDLDFVISNLEPSSRFIVRGQPWRVVDIREDEVLVEPISELGPVPAWSGEDIPVPWEVAREVALVRGKIRAHLASEEDDHPLEGLPFSPEARRCVMDAFREQEEGGFRTPDLKTITLESGAEGFVIGICGGTKVNETLGRLVGALLSARFGGNVAVDHDPYRIMLLSDLRLKGDDIRWGLDQIRPGDIERMIPPTLRNSPLIKWQMIHVAKKMGAMKRDVDPLRFPVKRLLARWNGSLIMEETMERITRTRFDVEHTGELISEIDRGKVELVIQRISPLTMSGASQRSEFISPGSASRRIIEQVMDRLNTRHLKLVCMKCGSSLRATAERSRGVRGCHRCGSRFLAPIPAGDIRTIGAVEKGVKGAKLRGEDGKRFRAALMAGELFMTYGYKAVLCIAARGVGPKTAGRILEGYHETDEELVRAIFGEEIRYARTRRYWE